MPYCTQADVENAAGGADKLIQLSDLENTGLLDVAVVQKAIDAASQLVDMYVGRRFFTAVSTPTWLTEIVADEAVYRLRSRRNIVHEEHRLAHEERLTVLRDIGAGRAVPGVDPQPPKSSDVITQVVEVDSSVHPVTRDNLGGFV